MQNRLDLAERDFAVAEAALEADPYNLGHLIQRLLAAAATRQVTIAQRCHGALQRMGIRGAYMRALGIVADSPALLRRSDHAYSLDARSREGAHDPAKAVDEAFESVARVTGARVPLCLVEFVPDSPLSNLAVVAIPDFRYIRLSRPSGDEKRFARTARHEAAHALLSSGNRFLDEGIATFFEKLSEPAHRDVEAAGRVPNLRAFLSMGAGGGLIFSEVADTDQARLAIYTQASRFVAYLVGVLGWPGVDELINLARTTAPGDLPLLVEQRLGRPLEAIEAELFGKRNSQSDLDTLVRDYCLARGRRDLGSLQRIAAALELGAAARGELEAIFLLAKVKAMQLIFAAGENTETHGAAVRQLAESIQHLGNIGLDQVRKALLEGQLSIARLSGTSDGALHSEFWHQARRAFLQALEINPHETEAALGLCALLLTTPPKWGGDAGTASRLLDNCRSDSRYAAEIDYWDRIAKHRAQEA